MMMYPIYTDTAVDASREPTERRGSLEFALLRLKESVEWSARLLYRLHKRRHSVPRSIFNICTVQKTANFIMMFKET